MRPDDVIDACRASHQRVLESVATLGEDELRAPSRLPGYSRAHVVAHVTNKADAHVRVFGGPAAGEVRRLFPDGYDADEAAATGGELSPRALLAALTASLRRLERAWDALEDSQWDAKGFMTAGWRSMAEIVGHHLRNVEVHHVDLDVGYRPSDWPAMFVEGELERRMRDLPGRADHADLLAWLLGRGPAPDLHGSW